MSEVTMTQLQNTSQSRLTKISGIAMAMFLGAFLTLVFLKSCEADAGYQSATISAHLDKEMGVK